MADVHAAATANSVAKAAVANVAAAAATATAAEPDEMTKLRAAAPVVGTEPRAPAASNIDQDEVAKLRAALAEAQSESKKRSEQLEAAKSKAKEIIRAQQKKATEAQSKLEQDSRSQQKTIDDLTRRITQLVPPPNAEVQTKLEEKVLAQQQTIDDLMDKIKQLVPPPEDADNVPPGAATRQSSSSEPAKKIAALRERLSKVDHVQAKLLATDCAQIERDVASLADDFLAAKTALSLAQEDGRSASRAAGDARKEGRDAIKQMSALEKTVSELRAQLKEAESKAAASTAATAASPEKDKEIAQLKDDKEALDVKLAGMDAILVEKNNELAKVRDKARVYLKEISADKKAMEQRMNNHMHELRDKLAEAQAQVKESESAAGQQDVELERMLALVSEKQKTIQSLNMACASVRKSVADKERQVEGLRDDFAKYKERARIALEERDEQLQRSDTAVQDATVELRAKLAAARDELATAKRALAEAQKTAADAQYNMERAVRAETALDLQRSSATSEASLHDARLRRAEEEAELSREQLTAANARAKDAEARAAELDARLQAEQRKAAAAEHKAEQLQHDAASEAAAARRRVSDLQQSLAKSNESASAAQRVAAVAARAMGAPTPNSSGAGGGSGPSASTAFGLATPGSSMDRSFLTPRGSPAHSAAISPLPLRASSRSMDEGLSRFSSDSLQKVMASHAVSIGLSSPRPDAAGEDAAAAGTDAFRDNQIAVLTSQLSELSTLLDDAQDEAKAREQQNELLKAEVHALNAQLKASQKLADGAPFSYLRSVVVAYVESPDPQLLPVLADVLAISKDELERLRARAGRPPRPPSNKYGLGFLGRR